MAELVTIFTNNIFSVVVSAYLLIKTTEEIKELNKNIIQLAGKIENICDKKED